MNGTVIIAGGGPTGLMLAAELGLAGVHAVVLERREQPAEASAGMAVHGRTVEVLRYRGLTDRITPEEMFAWPLTPFALLWLDMSVAAGHDYTYAYPQWRLERLLAARAQELGADLRRGHTVADAAQDDDGVVVAVETSAGRYDLRGDYLVGCDGAASTVRERAGIRFVPNGPAYYGVLGDMELADGADTSFDAGVHPNGMFGAIPLDDRTLRLMTIEFDVERPGEDVPVGAEELRGRIRRITGKDPRLGPIGFAARYGGPTSLAEHYRAERVFVAGDAAHSFFISGTQGVNTGVHDAVNLGWKLAATLNGWAPPGLLDTYHSERAPVGRRMCWHANAAMALVHPYPAVAPLRELVGELFQFAEVNRYLLEVTTAVRYPLPGAGAPDAAPAADAAATGGAEPVRPGLLGGPVPDVALDTATGVESVAQTLRTGRGVVLDLSDGAADLTGLAGFADRVDVVAAKPTPDLAAGTVLVRPDGVVAHVEPPGADGTGLRAALAHWFGSPAPR